MDKIKISDIEKTKNKYLHLDIEDEIIELNAEVSASLDITLMGEFINVSGNIQTEVKLECDLCLKEYNQKLKFDIDEMYARKLEYSEDEKEDIEIKDGQFIIDLYGSNEIDIYDLLYQSVILELPNKKVCGINCKEEFFEKFENEESFKVRDNRMDVFKTIKIEK